MESLIRYRALIFAALAILGWGLVLYLVPAGTLVRLVGAENAYLVSFIVASIAGFSTFTGAAAYATVIEFSRSGVDPLLLSLAAGMGLFLSDSAFYFLAMRGREPVAKRFSTFFDRVQRVLERIPNILVYLGVLVFAAIGPIPNDTILAALVVGGYQYRKFWPYLLAGDIAFMAFLIYLFQV